MGAVFYAEGNYKAALEAFAHALEIRRTTQINFSHRSTAAAVIRIAEIHRKTCEWISALRAYVVALELLELGVGDTEILGFKRKLRKTLKSVLRHMEKSKWG